MTPLSIITRALRAIGALAPGATLESGEAADGLTIANAMLNTWAAQRLMIYVVERVTYPLVTSQQNYTLGAGGDFNRARPEYIAGISVLSNNNPLQPIELPLKLPSTQQWQTDYPVKAVDSALPSAVYVNAAFPLRTLSYWPIPNVANLDTVLYLPTALTAFADLSTDYTFPGGYEEAIVYNLALRLAPEWGRQVPPEIREMATNAMMTIKIANLPWIEMHVDSGLLALAPAEYNWLTDTGG